MTGVSSPRLLRCVGHSGFGSRSNVSTLQSTVTPGCHLQTLLNVTSLRNLGTCCASQVRQLCDLGEQAWHGSLSPGSHAFEVSLDNDLQVTRWPFPGTAALMAGLLRTLCRVSSCRCGPVQALGSWVGSFPAARPG